MGKPLDFLLSLESDAKKPKTFIPEGRKYQSYDMVIDGRDRTILIPLKETTQFETLVDALPEKVTYEQIKPIISSVRGILQ